jgi:hypothetical protein
LIVLPVLDIYRKYYGLKMSAFLLGTFYASMALAALGVEFMFQEAGIVPAERKAQIIEGTLSLNYTTVLNIIFLVIGGFLVRRFFKTGGPEMLKMM